MQDAASRLLRRPLSLSILLALPGFAFAQATTPEAVPKATDVDAVLVTGSRIPRATVEGPSPVTVITHDEIDSRGFRSAFDALSSLTQNTGSVQGEDFGNTFTPAANVVNLRGFGPNHTLVLINGRRLADYPVAYDGSVNVVNLSNIPSALIDRIEVLAGGASAIYGSDAVAGVVNIILKQRFEGLDINARVGGTQQGGGQNQRLQLVSGKSTDNFDAVFGIELSHRKPIWGLQRDFMDSYLDDPDGTPPAATVVTSRKNAGTGRYIDPGAANCDANSALYHGSVFRTQTRLGFYCGSNEAQPTFWTVQTEKKNADAYGSLTWHLGEHADVFADLALDVADIANNTRAPSWTSEQATNGYFYNQASGQYETWFRRIAPEEIGSAHANNRKFLERSWAFTVGARGSFGESAWDYEVAYNQARSTDYTKRRAFLTGINEFFLGRKQGEDADGIGIYNPDPARLFTPLTTADYNALTASYTNRNAAWLQNLSFSVNGELFDLPGGKAGVAGVLEAGNQGYSNHPSELLGQGVFWNTLAGVPARGDRDRYAAGVEVNLPLLTQLTATAAARYDEYRFSGHSLGKATWNLGLEYRPIQSLLLRATAATSFRAPDMNYVFAAETRGYIPGLTDYWRCRTAGQDVDNCDFAGIPIDFTSTGSPDLKPENGKSHGFGAVWSPSENFDLSLDYYRIKLEDEVTNLDADGILQTESDCRFGSTESGEARDINSSLCQDALSRVIRNPPNAAVEPNQARRVLINAINASTETTSGIDLKSNVRWDAGRYGRFGTSLAYSLVIDHDFQQFQTDPVQDRRNSLDSFDWRSKLNGSVTWSIGRWDTTLFGQRYGSLPKSDGSGRIAPYALYNGSARYRFSDAGSLALIVNNLRNSRPPADRNGGGWPFYPVGNYDPYGRQFWLELSYRIK
ncbi:TonB-dependent receptor plug domain-containing protein [Lysobacter tyrosinilyticus]